MGIDMYCVSTITTNHGEKNQVVIDGKPMEHPPLDPQPREDAEDDDHQQKPVDHIEEWGATLIVGEAAHRWRFGRAQHRSQINTKW